MKLQSLFLPVALLFILFISSCKKENSNDTTNNNPNKLKLYIEDATNTSFGAIDSFTVSYDGNNRLTGLTSPNLKFVYAYSSNSFTLDLYEYGQVSIHEIYYINSSSLVDSTLQFDASGDTTTEKYVYSGKLLTSLSTYDYTTAGGAEIYSENDYTYDNNGNVIKEVDSDGNGDVNTISIFTYTDKPLNFSTSPIYLPVGSKYLTATKSQTDGSGNPDCYNCFSYVFDSQGRVTKETDSPILEKVW